MRQILGILGIALVLEPLQETMGLEPWEGFGMLLGAALVWSMTVDAIERGG